MNTKPSLRLINDGLHANSEYLTAIMTWPGDLSLAQHYTEASIKNLIDSDLKIEEASLFRRKNKELAKARWPGLVTGKTFLATLRGLSLEKAQFVTAKIMDGNKFNGKTEYLSRGAVRTHWRKFKTVAHLWAAYAILVENDQKPETNLIVQYAQKLSEMSLARGGIKGCELLIVETDMGRSKDQIDLQPISTEEEEILRDFIPHTIR